MENQIEKEIEIRLKRVRPQLHQDLKVIAKNIGVTLQSFLKTELTKIRDNNASYLKKRSID